MGGNLGLYDRASTNQMGIVTYSNSFDNTSVSAGNFSFRFSDGTISHEVFSSVSHKLSENTSASLTAGKDWRLYDPTSLDGSYVSGAVRHTTTVNEHPVTVSGKLNFNHNYYRENSGFDHAQFSVSSPINLGDGYTVTPRVTVQEAFEGDQEHLGGDRYPIKDNIGFYVGFSWD